jgi:hypothetical protein
LAGAVHGARKVFFADAGFALSQNRNRFVEHVPADAYGASANQSGERPERCPAV